MTCKVDESQHGGAVPLAEADMAMLRTAQHLYSCRIYAYVFTEKLISSTPLAREKCRLKLNSFHRTTDDMTFATLPINTASHLFAFTVCLLRGMRNDNIILDMRHKASRFNDTISPRSAHRIMFTRVEQHLDFLHIEM